MGILRRAKKLLSSRGKKRDRRVKQYTSKARAYRGKELLVTWNTSVDKAAESFNGSSWFKNGWRIDKIGLVRPIERKGTNRKYMILAHNIVMDEQLRRRN